VIQRTFLAQLNDEQLAAALQLAYTDYLAPVQFTPQLAAEHVSRNSVDLSRSPYWHDQHNQLVGLALLGIRDARGWIGGFGIAPKYRGQQLAAPLLAATVQSARDAGLSTVQLEVLAGNHKAYNVYREGGFHDRRQVSALFPAQEMPAHPLGELLDPRIVLAEPPPAVWQRELPWALDGPRARALRIGDEWLIFRPDTQGTVLLHGQARCAAHLQQLLGALRHFYPDRMPMITNEPLDSSLHAQLRELGWEERYPQTEMLLEL
jgi:ribosomal protein S18 acetylase RimI-like enzyme